VVQRYPPLVDGAFIIIAWVGVKLMIEYLHQMHFIAFEVPKWLSLGLIVVIFTASYLYARRIGAVEVSDDAEPNAAEALLREEGGGDAGDAPAGGSSGERG
jgi:predicted tellurium resistance membrane protein TerC